jgi:hypothetical protein
MDADDTFTPEVQELCRNLHSWIAFEMIELMRRDPSERPGGLLLSALVWGDKYVGRFLHLTAKSLEAESNRAALKDNKARIILFTDLSGFDKLRVWAEESTAAGVHASLIILPPPLMEVLMRKGDDGEWDRQKVFPTLGTTQTLAVKIAARHGMAYHSLFPDQVYSANYFKHLLALSERERVIVQSSISADYRPAVEALEIYRTTTGSIEISARQLGALGFRHLHKQSRGNLMNRGKEILGLPVAFQCIWQGYDRLYLHCCHTNPVYLAPEFCASAPVRYFSPIDCNLPYITGDRAYFPTVEDDMAFLELSDDSKEGTEEKLTPEVHAAVCWSHVKFRDIYMPWFAQGCEVPIARQPEWLEPDDIAERQAQVAKGIEAHKPIVEARIRSHDAKLRAA